MSGELWAFIFLFVILKIPVCAALYLVWWSAKAPAPADGERSDFGGGGGGPRHPRPLRPGPPRRGPHVGPPPSSPARVRVRASRPMPAHR